MFSTISSGASTRIAQDEVKLGRLNGVTGFNKFGFRDSLSAAAGDQVIWSDTTTDSFVPMDSADTYTITFDDTVDGEGTTGALTLAITHVNADGDLETFVHTLSGSSPDVTTATGFGINRCAVSSSGSNDVNAADITITDTTNSNVQAHVAAGVSVTQQAVYHIGGNHRAVSYWLWAKVAKLSGGSNVRGLLRGWAYNRNVSTKFLVFRCILDTASQPEINITDPMGFGLSPTDVLWFTFDTDTNLSEIDLRFSLNDYKDA